MVSVLQPARQAGSESKIVVIERISRVVTRPHVA